MPANFDLGLRLPSSFQARRPLPSPVQHDILASLLAKSALAALAMPCADAGCVVCLVGEILGDFEGEMDHVK